MDDPDDRPARLLREAGLRVTQQRLGILAVLEEAEDHPGAEELLARVRSRDETVSPATVYRTLKALEAAGLVHRLSFGGEPARFEMAPRIQHDHLVDVDTGEVIEIQSDDLAALRRRIAAEHGYEIVEHRTVIRGKRV